MDFLDHFQPDFRYRLELEIAMVILVDDLCHDLDVLLTLGSFTALDNLQYHSPWCLSELSVRMGIKDSTPF